MGSCYQLVDSAEDKESLEAVVQELRGDRLHVSTIDTRAGLLQL